MSLFHPVSMDDRIAYIQCLTEENTQSSSASFGNLFLWDYLCTRNVAFVDGRVCAEYLCCHSTPFFTYPIGNGSLQSAVARMKERAAENGRPLRLRYVSLSQKDALEVAFPGRFRFTADRNNADYIYSADALASLSGKKLHRKRNHCNKFEAGYRWHSEELTPVLFPACREILQYWNAGNNGGSVDETEAIERVFRFWSELSMEGTVLFADDEPVAFSVSEFLSADTVDVHFEKARDDVPGAYPMIARELIRQLRSKHPEINYVNREEDMGIPGLRKAKEEWYPLFLLEKFSAEEIVP